MFESIQRGGRPREDKGKLTGVVSFTLYKRFVCLPIDPSTNPTIDRWINRSIDRSIHPPTNQPIYLPTYIPTCLSFIAEYIFYSNFCHRSSSRYYTRTIICNTENVYYPSTMSTTFCILASTNVHNEVIYLHEQI